MTRNPNRSKRDLERLLDELKERKAARNNDLLDINHDVPDELVELGIQLSHFRLANDMPDIPVFEWGDHSTAQMTFVTKAFKKRRDGDRLNQTEARVLRALDDNPQTDDRPRHR